MRPYKFNILKQRYKITSVCLFIFYLEMVNNVTNTFGNEPRHILTHFHIHYLFCVNFSEVSDERDKRVYPRKININ